VAGLTIELGIPDLSVLIGQFLSQQLDSDSLFTSALRCTQPLDPIKVKVFHSAAVIFVALSDPSGVNGLH